MSACMSVRTAQACLLSMGANRGQWDPLGMEMTEGGQLPSEKPGTEPESSCKNIKCH